MAINIQDNFKLNIKLPIDDRIVASGSSGRAAIDSFRRYDGLSVFDTSDRKTYYWNDDIGNWTTSDVSGSGLGNSIVKWSGTSGLTSSGLFFSTGLNLNSGKLGINTNNPLALIHLVSDGAGPTQFVVHGYASGVIFGQNFFNNGSDQYMNFGAGSAAIRMSTTPDIDFLVRPFNRVAPLDTTSNTDVVLRIEGGAGGRIFSKKDIVMNYPPGVSQNQGSLLLRAGSGWSTKTVPDITWWYNDQCGFFHPSVDTIGITLGGVQFGRFTNSGLLLANDLNITTPNYKIHIDSGNAQQSFIQFTQGGTTGVGSGFGAIIGITSEGNAGIFSRFNSSQERGIVLGFSGTQVWHKFNRNSYTLYSLVNGTSTPNANNVTRVVRGSKFYSSIYTTSPVIIESLTLPNNCQVSIEATFVSSILSSPKQFRTTKILSQFTVNASGAVTTQNTGSNQSFSGSSEAQLMANLSSTSATGIDKGYFTTAANTVNMVSKFNSLISGSSLVSYTAVINTSTGH
jgi:hypothetical protein